MFASIMFINTIVLIIWRPYKQAIHNFSIIFNSFVVILLIGYSIAQYFMVLTEFIDMIFSYAMLGLILVIEILALVRLKTAGTVPKKEVQRIMKNDKTKIE